MSLAPFCIVSPATRGLSLALTRHLLRNSNLPVYATHRSDDPDAVRQHILSSVKDIDPDQLRLLRLDLTSEQSIAAAAESLAATLPSDRVPHLDTAFFTGGILHPERQLSDIDADNVAQTFQINVVSHLLIIKYFSRFLSTKPVKSTTAHDTVLTKWVHMSARVGSISDNHLGGWFSYRASKAALNQVVRTFDLYLQQKQLPAMCIGLHPGTVRTDLSRAFWSSVPQGKLFDPEYAAEHLFRVVRNLKDDDRGKIWDWAGKGVPP